MIKTRKRIGAAFLAATLLIGQLGATAYAEGPPDATGGLCEHHTTHDAACGYVEAIPGGDCEHTHTMDCYTDELICGYEVDAEQTATGSDASHQHGQACYALDCPHERGEHDTDCGYIEAVPGTPCGYVCDQCGKEPDKDSGTTPVPEKEETVQPEGAGTITVTAFDGLDEAVKYQTVPAGTRLDGLTLPATLGASGYHVAGEPTPEPITIDGVTWEPDSPWDETARQGVYTFTPVLPAGYARLDDTVELPEIAVRIGVLSRVGADPNDTNGDNYHDGDVAVINAIIHNNGLSATKDDPASWQTAGLVYWDDNTPKRIHHLSLVRCSLTGALDVSGLTNLTKLTCDWNQIDKLDVSGLTNLTALFCKENQLTALNGLDKLTNLTLLTCNKNRLTGTLDVGNLTKLTFLDCSGNQLEKIEGLGSLTNLTKLTCSGNQLDKLEGLGSLTNLTVLDCSGNQLDKLEGLGSLTNLTLLTCNKNRLTGTLDVGNLTNLTELSCYNNQLDKLEGLDSLTKLKRLFCYKNRLTGTLDVGSLTNLTLLYCNNNRLTGTLDVENLTNLTELNCANNQLDRLEGLDKLTNLTQLYCDNNRLTGMPDVSGYPNLQTLSYEGKSIALKDGTVRAENGGKVKVQFGPTFNGTDWVDIPFTLTALPGSGYHFKGWTGLPSSVNHKNATVSFTPGTGYTYTANFTSSIVTIPVTGVTLNKSAHTLYTNKDPRSFQLTATVEPANASNKAISWQSSNPGVATVDGSGNVTAIAKGTATITVTTTDGNKMAACTVTVKEAPPATIPVTGVALDKSAHTLYTNKDPRSFQLTATVEPADASNKAVSWQSSNPGVATVDGSGNVTAIAKGTATITVTTTDGGKTAACTVTVETDTGGNGGGGGGNSGGSSRNYIITTPQPPKPNNPVLAVIELSVTVGNGTATGKPDDGRTASAIAEAGRNAKAKTNGIAVQYDAKTAAAYDGFSITIRRATLDRLIDAKVKYVTLNTGIVDLTFDLAALGEIQKQATGDVTLTATRETGLTGDALAAVGSRPAYRLAVSYTGKDGKAATVTNFGAGRVTVGLAYKPAENEQTGSLFLVYSADGKGAEWLYQSSYSRTSGNVVASTGHFSVYAVGYKPAPAFADTVNHWAKADIDFVASRGLLAGTGDATFTPDGTTTRGMFAQALGRLAGIDPAAYPSSRFTDVAATAYYAPYVEWAASKGIVTGTGEKTFSPDATITREQMAAIMQRYADKLGYTLPVAREAEIFADEGQITSGMESAVQAMQQAGVMNGKGGHRFGPKDTATRAEAAAVLRRFVEIVIDPAAAGGWGQNDAGKWLYYENNRPVTGWKQIDRTWYYFDAAGLMQAGGWREISGKWYYFYPDGAMAVNTKIDGYEIGPDGVRKENE